MRKNMKTMKKLAALLLSVVMTLAMAVTTHQSCCCDQHNTRNGKDRICSNDKPAAGGRCHTECNK